MRCRSQLSCIFFYRDDYALIGHAPCGTDEQKNEYRSRGQQDATRSLEKNQFIQKQKFPNRIAAMVNRFSEADDE